MRYFSTLGLAAAAVTLVILISVWRGDGHTSLLPWRPLHTPSAPAGVNYRSASSRRIIDTTSELGRASNATLGFEKILVLALKERYDKRDAMILSSSLTGFDVEFIDGIRGEDIAPKALPPGMTLQGGALGSWRTHIDAISSIVERKLSSALIMEDDVDWDIRLPLQMPDFARGVRTLSNIPLAAPQHSPYGDDWDVLWPGHCGEVLPEHDDRRFIISDDVTVAPKEHQPWLRALADYPEGTRLVQKAGAPICSFAYAVSFRGAQKLLLAQAIRPQANLAWDNSLAYLCRDGYLDIKCYSVQPTLFFHHRPAGSVSKDSDIMSGDPEAVREKGVTENIVLSSRLNLEPMIMGNGEFVMQW